jgi:hypothetical protein
LHSRTDSRDELGNEQIVIESDCQILVNALNNKDYDRSPIVTESDCQILVNALNNKDYDRSPIGVLIRDARILARLNFSSISFNFYRRNFNKLVHVMAALGASGAHDNGQASFGLMMYRMM